jgi:hypothetical protein
MVFQNGRTRSIRIESKGSLHSDQTMPVAELGALSNVMVISEITTRAAARAS